MALNPVTVANELVTQREATGALTKKSPTTTDFTGNYDRATSPSISPSEQSDMVQHVKQLFYRARAVRRPLIEQWMKNYEILHNRTWGTGRASWMPTPEVPEIYPILAALIGWETDQRPTFEVNPAAQPYSPAVQFYDQLADDLETLLRTNWTVEDYEAEIEKMLWDAKLYGTGILKTIWDPTLVGGMGNVMVNRIDPWTFYPDPDAKGMKDASHFIEVYTVSKQELERRFPGSLTKLQGMGWVEDSDEAPTMTSNGGSPQAAKANPGALAPNTNASYGLPGQSGRIEITDDPGITTFEAWLKVPCEIEDTRPTSDGGTEPVTRRYDAWRVIVIAGNTVLFDCMAEEIYEHGQHPYDRYVPHDTGEFFGTSLVELLAPSQISINKLLAAIEQNIWLMGNPIWVEDTRSRISRQSITNRPGQRIEKAPGSEAGWKDPPQMHPQMSSELIQFYINEMERISGLSAIVRGATPGGRNAEGVLDSVQEAAFVRIRLGLRSLERTLSSVGAKAGSLIADFYDTPRIIAIVGPTGERSALALRPNHFYMPGPGGLTPVRFQILVGAGSMNPIARGARIAEADTLFAMGAIDEEAVLEAHDFPNRNIITARVRELKAANGTLGQPPGARQRAQRTT